MSSDRSAPAIELRGPALAPGTPLNDKLAAFVDDLAPAAIEEEAAAYRVFFFSRALRDSAAAALGDFAAAANLDIRSLDVPDENWVERSQASLGAVEVGRFVIAPPWDRPPNTASVEGPQPIVITILPSTGFGTGHHASTRLALAALDALDVKARHVIDVGTGSGILAIAAVRLGAGSVLAIDADQDAIDSAVTNLALNAPLDKIDVRHMELGALTSAHADIVCANLTGALIARYAEQLAALVRVDGALLLSGFTADEEWRVSSAFPKLRTTARYEEDGWIALVLQAGPEDPVPQP